jgi:hypothetical protein
MDALHLLSEQKYVVARNFRKCGEGWLPIREAIEDQLCFAPALQSRHLANKEAYLHGHPQPDPMLGQLLWGGAGMLARAHHTRLAYSGHPLREKLLADAKFLPGPASAQERVSAFVDEQRLQLCARLDASGYFAKLRLPAVLVEVVEESRSAGDLISTAVQLRDRYAKLRAWIGEFQRAIDTEDVAEIESRGQMLAGIARGMNVSCTPGRSGDVTVQVGISALKLSAKLDNVADRVRNRFGVRAQIVQMVRTVPGRRALEKLATLLGGGRTRYAVDLEHALLERGE